MASARHPQCGRGAGVERVADPKPIRNANDYEVTLSRIERIMDAEPGTAEGQELDALTDLVELYESKNEPMGYPDPVAAIEFRMEQAGLAREI